LVGPGWSAKIDPRGLIEMTKVKKIDQT
jgi:hypothetical protein